MRKRTAYVVLEKAAKELRSPADSRDFLFTLCKSYGLSYLTYTGLGLPFENGREVISTVPDGLIERNSILEEIAPHYARWKTRREGGIYGDDAMHGITTAIFSPHGTGSGFISIISSETTDKWDARMPLLLRDICALGSYIHSSMITFRRDSIVLSDRQKQCLTLTAMGLNIEEASRKMEVCERTVKRYLEEAKTRLKAKNNAQAVARAVSLGIVRA